MEELIPSYLAGFLTFERSGLQYLVTLGLELEDHHCRVTKVVLSFTSFYSRNGGVEPDQEIIELGRADGEMLTG